MEGIFGFEADTEESFGVRSVTVNKAVVGAGEIRLSTSVKISGELSRGDW
ncbi:MAG: hypothetical protein ACYDHP_13970 [Ferrimicrobium sp.]